MRISDWNSDVCSSDLRYRQAQIFAFDHGGSIRAGVLGIGGEWHDLGGSLSGNSSAVALQPLARIDELDERAWAADWLAAILAREEFAITPEVKDRSAESRVGKRV